MLQQIESFFDIFCSDKMFFALRLTVFNIFNEFWDDFGQFIRNVFADENQRELSLWQENVLNKLTEMQKKHIDGHEYEQFVIFILLDL